MPRRRLVSIVLVSASLGMVSGIAGALTAMRPMPAHSAGFEASTNAAVEAAFLNFASAEKRSAAVARPARIDELMSSNQASTNCKQGTWPYFDKNCLWAASKKQNRARPIVARPTPAIAAATASAAATSAASLPVPALPSKQIASVPSNSRAGTRKANASHNAAAEKIAPLVAYDSYAAFPRAAVSGFPLPLQPRFMHD
jgi:hypothetical protein